MGPKNAPLVIEAECRFLNAKICAFLNGKKPIAQLHSV